MKITEYSRFRLMQTARNWDVEPEYFEPIYRYLVHGISPGSFFTSVLAGDWFGAIQRSHPSNSIEGLKSLSGWITDSIPSAALHSYKAVESWCSLPDDDRRRILEEYQLIYTEKEEVEMALRGKIAVEPYLL